MQLEQINRAIAGYRDARSDSPHAYLWEVQSNFQTHWNLSDPHLAEMIDRSISSSVNRRMWSRSGYQPKAVLLHFSTLEAEQVQWMFRDLFAEEKDLLGRIERFIWQAQDLLTSWREAGKKPLLADHDQDLAVISLYLSLRYPLQYIPYDHDQFVKALRYMRVREIPPVADYPRALKIANTLQKMLLKAEVLPTAKMGQDQNPVAPSLLLAWDFMAYMAALPG
jgi:hypothetical protein